MRVVVKLNADVTIDIACPDRDMTLSALVAEAGERARRRLARAFSGGRSLDDLFVGDEPMTLVGAGTATFVSVVVEANDLAEKPGEQVPS
jgi:hypothetical protein